MKEELQEHQEIECWVSNVWGDKLPTFSHKYFCFFTTDWFHSELFFMSEEKFKPHTISLGQTQTESLLQTPATNTNFGENENNNKQSKILVPVSPSVIQNVHFSFVRIVGTTTTCLKVWSPLGEWVSSGRNPECT